MLNVPFYCTCEFYRLTEGLQLILFYKNDPEFLVIREKAGITVASLQLSVGSIFYLWPLYKHVVHVEKLLGSGQNLFLFKELNLR